MIERVEARIKEITAEVKQAESKIQTLTQEYHQLLGYRQALLDMQEEVVPDINEDPPTKTTQEGA